MSGITNKLTISNSGYQKLKAHEAEIDGLYDDVSGYGTFGIGHLIHPHGKYRSFLLAAALADPKWKPYVDYKVWSKKKHAKKMPFLPRRVGTVRGADDLEKKGLIVAQTTIAKATYHKDFSALTGSHKTKVETLSKEAVARERALLSKTADHVFRADLRPSEKTVNHGITGVALNQDEFDALVSFEFNVGPGNFTKSSLRKRINQAHYRSGSAASRRTAIGEIEESFKAWNKSKGKVVHGLTLRREAEAKQFLKQAHDELKAMGHAHSPSSH